MNYWAKRQAKIQEQLTNKSQKTIDKQLRKYYAEAAQTVIEDFEKTYDKVLLQIESGQQPTPALLYKLDTYWKMQGQLRQELNRLGEKEIALLTKEFELNFFEIYYSIALDGDTTFNTIDTAGAQQLINAVWLADGKNFSQRVWDNVKRLTETLNDELINCVVTGKKTTELKNTLQKRFGVSYSRANTLVRTELAHIQTISAKQRYLDAGLDEYEILGNDDDSCGNHSVDCHKMDGKRFKYSEMQIGVNAPPFHPNCKCCILPVID